MTLLVDATTAQHARGIRTVTIGILNELPHLAPHDTIVAAGPDLRHVDSLRLRRVGLARHRPGRLLYQRLLLPLDIARLSNSHERVDRVLLLDSYVPMVRPQRDVRYASLVHDVLPLTHPHFWPVAKRLVKRSAFRSLRSARATLFTSTEYNAREIQRLIGADARVVRFGCGQLRDDEADNACTSPLPEREPYLLHVGALEPRKDVLSLLSAFERAGPLLGDNLSLTLVGKGSRAYTAMLEERLARSACRERVRIVRRASRETTLRLLARASALVFPSLAEGFGLPILEALALGTPVVASDIPEIRSWAEDSVLYAPPGHPEGWAESIGAAIDSGEAKRRAGQAFARDYRWRTCTNEMLSF
jgi:glycosyltransferase involved in cell wall biosynthesis